MLRLSTAINTISVRNIDAQAVLVFKESGLVPEMVTGDKFKRKVYLPIYALLALINRFKLWRYKARETNVLSYPHMTGNDFLMSMSLIGVWVKSLD